MKIEEGKFYRARDGQKIGPMQSNWCDDRCWPFVCRPEHERMYWRHDGEACEGNVNRMRPDLDLVSEWSEGPVRTVTTVTKVIEPGQYGIVNVRRDGGTDFGIFVHRGHHSPAELRAAAATLAEIADALGDAK